MLLAGALLAFPGSAEAAGTWLSEGSLTPVEHRIAVAVGPSRTTLWTSLRFDAAGGPVAIVIPAAPGASLDISSDAWFEALEVATAPRIFPPPDLRPYCPGETGSPNVFQLDGQVTHTRSLAPEDVTVLGDVGALSIWAAQWNLTIPASVVTALSGLEGQSLVALRFATPPGMSVTPTIRVSTPGGAAVLPLALTHAAGSNLKVTAWMLGQGEADLGGGVRVVIDSSKLSWKASTGTSNYDDLRTAVLGIGPDAFLIEAASHASLSQSTSIAQGTASIDGVLKTFFERAVAYANSPGDAAACITATTPLLASTAVVAAACPAGALGAIAPVATCTESPGPGQVDPAALRCGASADDLALALSGLTPASVWVTRQSLLIPADGSGVDTTLTFASAKALVPVIETQTVDLTGCGNTGTGSSSGSASGSSSGSMSTGSGYDGPSDGFGVVVDSSADIVDGLDASGCDCSGTSSTSSPDAATTPTACDGSSSSDSSSSSSCSGSSSDSSSSSSSCSGSSGSSSDSCSGNSGGESSSSCSGSSGGSSSSFNCSTAGPRRLRAPKLSILLMLGLAVAAPLRRRGRRRRAALG